MRKLFRELVVCMLAGLVLGSIGTAVYRYRQLKKEIREQAKATHTPDKVHPCWIYVDIAQEFNGYLDTRPKVPHQIEAMVKAGKECEVGSKTFSEDGIEWICVEPMRRPEWMARDGIIVPIPNDASVSTLPPLPQGYTLDQATQDPWKGTSMSIDYKALGLESLVGGAYGFLIGLPLWLFYRLVRFAIKG